MNKMEPNSLQLQQPMPQTSRQWPASMNHLAGLLKIGVKQKPELLEAMTGFETNNKYDICDGAGRPFMQAVEDSGYCARCCCGPRRPFVINIADDSGRAVISVIRSLKCNCFGQCCSCFGCCQDRVEVQSPPGQTIGYVVQECSMCSPTFSIRDAGDNTVLRLEGPCYCLCRCPGQNYKFRMMSADGSQEVGQLDKEWSGFVKEVFTDADNFSIEVPADMAVETKATLIAAVFLIDFMFFEDSGKKNKAGSRNIAHAVTH